MTVQRVTLPSHTAPSPDDPRGLQLSFDLRAAVCSDAPLLISGDRDAARLVARVVHDHNPRHRSARFVSVTHETLAEKLAAVPFSQGVKGAEIGADDARDGDGLTLFIDDVDRLSPAGQDMLMFFLEVVHGSSPTPDDHAPPAIRVVAATTRDLRERVTAGKFRSDLLYRLNVIHVSMPLSWKAGERQLHTLLATLSA